MSFRAVKSDNFKFATLVKDFILKIIYKINMIFLRYNLIGDQGAA